jgi:hypothetical protein
MLLLLPPNSHQIPTTADFQTGCEDKSSTCTCTERKFLTMTKHQTFKNIWQYSKRTRTTINGSGETVSESQADEVPETLPPRYTELPSKDDSRDVLPKRNNPYPILAQLSESNEIYRHSNFLWCLLEIVAVTFFTDCERLGLAIVKNNTNTAPKTLADIKDPHSIMNEKRRAMTAETCALIRTLQEAVSHNRWLLICGRDRELVKKMVLEPVMRYKLDLDYVLEVFGRYRRVEGCPRPESTLVDYWVSSSFSTDLGDTIASHALLLRSGPLPLDMILMVEDSIATYQKENGFEELETSKELQEESLLSPAKTCCWPLSEEYMELARALNSLQADGDMHDPFEPSRTRLRDARKLRKH